MARISTHVLDTALGRPAPGVAVQLEILGADGWVALAAAVTDADGRIPSLADAAESGRYRLIFDTGAYLGARAFYPEAIVVFRVGDSAEHVHVPLLLSPFGYTTYRGS